jgi:hypothetical protein
LRYAIVVAIAAWTDTLSAAARATTLGSGLAAAAAAVAAAAAAARAPPWRRLSTSACGQYRGEVKRGPHDACLEPKS